MEQEKQKKMITILVPAYNEEEVLDMLYERLKTIMNQNTKYDLKYYLLMMVVKIVLSK